MTHIIDTEPTQIRRTNDRLIEFQWPVRPGEHDSLNGDGTVYAVLCVSHDGDRKRFWATTHPATIYANGVTTMSVSVLAQGFRLIEPTARYSVKALEAFAVKAVAALRAAHAAGDPKVTALFDNQPTTV
jgi:hypothetical protein